MRRSGSNPPNYLPHPGATLAAAYQSPPATAPAYPNPPAYSLHPPRHDINDSSDSDDDHEHGEGEFHQHCVIARNALVAYGIPASHYAKINLVLDVSSSMEQKNQFFSSGRIQKLIEKIMAIASELSGGEQHTMTIFPFGGVAYEPIRIEEHDIKKAVARVYQVLGSKYATSTNYNAAITKVRQHYFGHSNPLSVPQPSDQEPVLTFFLTDGEANEKVDEARNQFRYSEYSAMFIKFIALRGVVNDLNFLTLQTICNPARSYLENKSLLMIDDPDEITIPTLLDGYRPWLEEAHEHGVLVNDPGVELNPENLHDQADIARLRRLEKAHGHDSASASHGHIKANAPLLNQHGTFRSRQQHHAVAARQHREYPREEECCRCTIL